MKILIVSDLHSNYEALLAVAHAEADADEVWCLGDLVDFGPQPAEVVQWVRHHATHCIRGNHDNALGYDVDCRAGPKWHDLSVASREMNRALLSPDQIEYLRQLPTTTDVTVEECRFRLGHAGPDGDLFRYDLTPDADDARIGAAMTCTDAEFVLCGHTHLPMQRTVGRQHYVNPGSVGLQRLGDGDLRASYAVWQDGVVRLRRVEYDVEKTAALVRSCALPAPTAERLARLYETGIVG